MSGGRLVLLSSAAPDSIGWDFELGSFGEIVVGGRKYKYDFHLSKTLRIVGITHRFDKPLSYLSDHMSFWADQLPLDDQLLVRSQGWRALWQRGLPLKERKHFHLLSRADVVGAMLDQPTEAVFSLEVLTPSLEDPTDSYFGFSYNGWGWNPIVVGKSHRIRRFTEALLAEYTGFTHESLQTTEGLLKSAHEQSSGTKFP